MLTPHRPLALVALVCLAGCPVWDPLPSCAEFDACTTSSGSTSASTGDDPTPPTGGVQTVTSDGEATAMTAEPLPPVSTTTGEAVVPAVSSVMFTPDPLEHVGIIDVEIVAEHADHVRMDRPGFPSVELSKGQGGHFHGAIEVLTGLSNGTHEAAFVPRLAEVEGTAEIGFYTVAMAEAGTEVHWDTIPDDGPGQVEALAVLGENAIVGLVTLFDGNEPHCYLHRRNLDGTYAGDPQILFPEYACTAVDILTADETIYLLAMVTGGDGPRWRLASMTWGATPTVLRTGVKDEVAHALARSANGTIVACGTGPSPAPIMDTIDGRAWTLNGSTAELDYRPPPEEAPHEFDETVTDCAFRGDQLLLVGEVFGKHEDGLQEPWRKRPFVVEIDGQGEPHWIVPGLGPGNTTQGGATALALDDQGRAVVGVYTCGDMCDDPEPELRRYELDGEVDWQVTLPADVSVPFDLAWSPAGYAIIAGAHGTGLDTQFLLEGYVPGTYTPAWTFAKGKRAGLHVAFAVVAAPGVVVGAGLGVGGYPAFAFVQP